MDIRSTIEFVRQHKKELVLFNIPNDDPIVTDLQSFFETQNLCIKNERTASGHPTEIAVLSTDTEILTLHAVDELRSLVAEVPTGHGDFGIADAEYEGILTHLKETTFTSYDKEQLHYASREIEDRARRIGDGQIYAGFQRCSIMAGQASVYTDLSQQGVSVHAYGIPDEQPPLLGDGHVHAIDSSEIAKTWFVVFDGAGDDRQKCALLAEETGPDSFYGVWTYDPPIVDSVIEHLERAYLSKDDDQQTRPDEC